MPQILEMAMHRAAGAVLQDGVRRRGGLEDVNKVCDVRMHLTLQLYQHLEFVFQRRLEPALLIVLGAIERFDGYFVATAQPLGSHHGGKGPGSDGSKRAIPKGCQRIRFLRTLRFAPGGVARMLGPIGSAIRWPRGWIA